MHKGLHVEPIGKHPEAKRCVGNRIPADIPLGTAAWFRFAKDETPICKSGDFFLSRLPSGEPVGFRDDRHVLITAGTRSGKGASILVPNLAIWPGSVFIVDPKGENAMVTARRRSTGSRFCKGKKQKVRILDPFNIVRTALDSFHDLKVRFNPLDILKRHPAEAVDMAAQIAEAIVIAEHSNDPFWEEAAIWLLTAVILHVLSWKEFKDHERNLVTVWRLLRRGDQELAELLRLNGNDSASALTGLFDAMRRNPAYDGVVAGAGERFGSMAIESPRSFNGMLQVACTNTKFMDSPQIRQSLECSDFDLSDLKTEPKGVSVFLCLPQRYMKSHNRWLRMIVTLTIFEMERVAHQPKCGHPVLSILDEFPSLNRMAVIENAVAQIAGYGVKLVMVAQSLPQLKEQYKDNWETLVANCGVKLFFSNGDQFTREYVSKLIGEHEVVRTTRTQSTTRGNSASIANGQTIGASRNTGTSFTHGMSSGNFSSSSTRSSNYGSSVSHTRTGTSGSNSSVTHGTNESVHKRYLINPDEVGRYFGDDSKPRAIALISGLQPLCLERISYYADESFAGWYDLHSDHAPPRTLERLAQDRANDELDRQKRAKEQAAAERRKQQEKREAERLEILRLERVMQQRWLREQERERQKRWEREENIRDWMWIGGMVVLFPPVIITVMTSLHAYKTGKPILAQLMKTWSSLLGIG